MSRVAWMRLGGALLVALAVAAGAFALVRDGAGSEPGSSETTASTGPPSSGSRAASTTTSGPAAAESPGPLLVWTAGGLPAAAPEQIAALPGVERVTVVRGDLVDLVASTDAAGAPVDAAPPGMRIPLDALAIDPATYPAFVPGGGSDADALARLQPGEAVLGATSARLRRLGPGGVLALANGATVTVTAVVADEAVGAAELVVATAGAPAIGVSVPRFLLVAYSGDRAGLEAGIAALLPGQPVRFRAEGETPYLRHADLVLPQAVVKERFGEFAYRDGADRFLEVDPAYEAAHIAAAPVPILGQVTCHRDALPAIEGALRELEQAGLAGLVDPAGYQGCYVASIIPGSGGVSRHSWGIAIDVNFLPNPTELASFADPRLEAVMERWGFVPGSRFLTTDPGHFEYVGSPQ
ncbi:MAG TPA: M15 family metallopeptidase [Acidimicrobiia bacterium]